MTLVMWQGNCTADHYAGKGAKVTEIPGPEAALVAKADKWTYLICHRLMHIVTTYFNKQPLKEEQYIRVLPPKLHDIVNRDCGHHLIQHTQKTFKCIECNIIMDKNMMNDHLSKMIPCRPSIDQPIKVEQFQRHFPVCVPHKQGHTLLYKGKSIHPSHRLGWRDGTLFCWKCCKKGSKYIIKLGERCTNRCTQQERSALGLMLTRASDNTPVPEDLCNYIIDTMALPPLVHPVELYQPGT